MTIYIEESFAIYIHLTFDSLHLCVEVVQNMTEDGTPEAETLIFGQFLHLKVKQLQVGQNARENR